MTGNRKAKYAEKALETFKQDGLRLSLDEISEKIGVTKKTLYNHFDSKEELLSECIHTFVLDLKQRMSIMTSADVNAVDGLKCGVDEIAGFFRTLSPVFLSDIKKMYPEIANTEHTTGFAFFLEGVKLNLLKGIEEQLFRNDLNVELISQYFTFSLVSFFISRVASSSAFLAGDYFNSILDYHLQAIVTEQGRKLLNSTSR